MVVMTVGHLSEAAWHHPDLVVTYDSVKVQALDPFGQRPSPTRISPWPRRSRRWSAWQPAQEGGRARRHAEADPKYAYITYD